MRFCPWISALVGRWRRRTPRPKQTVDCMPTPKLDAPRIISAEEMRRLHKSFRAHRPGTTIVARDGTEYVVQRDGSYRRNDDAGRNRWPRQ